MNQEPCNDKEEQEYIEQLKPREKAAMQIAIRMTSFDLRKSNGFLKWKKGKEKEKEKEQNPKP